MDKDNPILVALGAAQKAFRAGDTTAALDACLQVLEYVPNHPMAHLMAGLLKHRSEDHDGAIRHLRFAVAHDPKDTEARDALGMCLAAKGRHSEALPHLRQVMAAQPDNANARYNFGRCLLDLKKYSEAERVYEEHVQKNPGDAEAFNHLGLARLAQGRYMAAEQCFRTSINLNPHDPIFHANLAQAFAHSEQASQAREAYQKAIDLDPASASFRTQFGWFLVEDGKPGEAEDSFREALQRDHECENASSGLATVLAMRSELEVGMAVLRPFISAIRPHVKVASSYATLCRKTDQAAQALPVVRRAIRPGVSRSDEVALRFAEGDLLDSMGNVDAAFDAYQRANQAQASGYDAAAHKHFVDSLISTFTPALFASMSSPTIDTSASVLVCGMPRSGSGLVSKVLGQHSDVFVAGELDDLSTMAREIGHFVGVEGRYPELISDLDGELVAKLSMARMESLRRVSGAPFVVDTFSNNFLHLGLAAIVTPGAKVIHTVRDPVDTCLSCYFQHFGGSSFAFSNRLDAISSYFSQYHRLMKHWEQVLPLEVLTVQYQDLVGDTDQVSARLLGFIGRDWDADIREAQKSQIRAAAVAYAHVRDPIAPEESNNSERYRHHIGELVAVASLRP